MTQSEFLELAAVYKDSCQVIGDGGLDSLICSLLKLLEVLNLTIIVDIAAILGIDLSPVLILVQDVLGTVNDVVGGFGLGDKLGEITRGGRLGGITRVLGGLGRL